MVIKTKCIVIIAGLLAMGASSASADQDIWNDVTRHGRGDFELHGDFAACAQQYGMPQNGEVASASFKRCMRSHGWRFVQTKREETYTDPETGLPCHDVQIFGVTASECSNF